MAKPETTADEIRARAQGLAEDLSRHARHAADEAAEALEGARERGRDYAERARSEAERIYHRGERRLDDAARHAGEYYDDLSALVRRHPAQALGVAAGLGFLLGLAMSRR
ncbi:DUF883 domain-containing protein [Paracoccus sp. (in: a-proteobacteria)]|uniref:DUF883 family protein n=1 Tax=Paracoccus sp. TaxID=267 RepID=UPI00321F8185